MTRKKGFTLIELIAVIVLLAIVLGITVPIISGIVKSVKEKACILDAQLMERSAQKYTELEGISVPKDSTLTISLITLQAKGYISVVLSPEDRKTECSGYVNVINDNGDVQYKGYLKCANVCKTAGYNDDLDTVKTSNDLDTKLKNGDQYFEGANPNNWVKFGRLDANDKRGIMWRIVKIDKTGIKMVYEGNENGLLSPLEDGRALIDGTMGIPWDNQAINKWNRQASLVGKLDEWLSRINVVGLDGYVSKTKWKVGGVPYEDPTNLQTFLTYQDIDSTNVGGSFNGLTNYESSVGMINAVDFMYTSDNEECMDSYKETGSDNECAYNLDGTLNNFLQKDRYHYWTLNARSDSPYRAWNITNSGLIGSNLVNLAAVSVRPVLNLKLDTVFLAGTGTIDDPYILEDYMLGIWDAPMIKLKGDNPTYVRQYDQYVDEGATAYDEQDGDISYKIFTTGTVDINTPGEYEITYNVKDSNDNDAIPVTRKVVVVDRDRPIIKLKGDNPTYVTITRDYTEKGATAYDINYGDISSDISITGTVDTNTLGTYYLKYNVTNKDGLKAPEVERQVVVGIPTPTIVLNGPATTLVDIGTSYVEEGATASDEIDGDLTNQIVTSLSKYNEESKQWEGVNSVSAENLGDYKIRYSVTNSFGANAFVDRTIKIVPTDGPLITYTPDGNNTSKKEHDTVINVTKTKYEIDQATLKYFIYNQYSVLNAKDFDSYFKTHYGDGDTITIKGGTAYYYVYAIAKDIYGNPRRTRTKGFKMDNSKPVIYQNPGTGRVRIYTTYTDPGATAEDEYYDGNLTDKIITTSDVDTNKEGIYNVTYEVSDSAGNTTTSKRRVEVYHPAPEIFLNGGSSIDLVYGTPYVEPGATATDEIDGDLTNKIIYEGSVNHMKEGTYELKYSVTNSAGYKATRVRTVRVYIPLPEITILGDNPVKLLIHTPYKDAGATVIDALDGPLDDRISSEGTVNVDVAGTYTITYSVTNNLGKTTTAKRTVEVYIPKPVITITGSNPATLMKTQTYSDAGATATDELDGDLTNKIITEGTVNVLKEGQYDIKYSVTNSEGGYSEAKRKVVVRKSNINMVITGKNPVELIKGSTYFDAGCTATDELDGDITNNITAVQNINPNIAGTYQVVYSVTNSGGDTKSVTRTVTVREPKVEIKLNGEAYIELPIGSVYVDEGATATDELLGDITDKIQAIPDLNPNILGTYKVDYEVTSSGVTAKATRTIKVVPLEGPMITFNPNGDSTWKKQNQTTVTITKSKYDLAPTSYKYFWKKDLSMPKEEAFASATSFNSGDTIQTPIGETGKYYLFVLAKDVLGNVSIMGSNGFSIDNTAPVLTLIGNRVVETPVDGVYSEQGATVVEQDSGLDNNDIVIVSNVVPGVIGTYTITYDATDKAGNKATQIKRTVSVIEASLVNAPGDDFVPKYDASYFIGNNAANWIQFGNVLDNGDDYVPIMWRIIKANDDGVQIIYEGVKSGSSTTENGTIGKNVWDSSDNTWNRPASIRQTLTTFFNNLSDANKATLTKAIKWCVGKANAPYSIDSFKADECTVFGDTVSAVGLVRASDYILTSKAPCNAYNQASCGTDNFLKKGYSYFSITSDVSSPNAVFMVNSNGGLTRDEVMKNFDVRPVINLRPDVLILGGEGTFEDPYRLNSRIASSDKTAPAVTFNPASATGHLEGRSVEVVVTDSGSGVNLDSLKYVWTTSTTQPTVDTIVNSFENGTKIAAPTNLSTNYYLWVLALDNKGNQTITKGGPYAIDNDPPVITINGDLTVLHKLGMPYTDAGATANDSRDGKVNVTVETNLNVGVRGTYQVTYTAIDKAGNKATATRTVVVNLIEIRTPEDLYNVRNDIYADYIVVNDIDMTNSVYKDNFPVIDKFYGTIDGNNKKIIGLKISGNGLFTTLYSGSEIYDMELDSFINNSPTLSSVGSITGTLGNTNVKLDNITVDSTSLIKGANYVGGLVGNVSAINTLSNMHINANVSGTGYVGGIVGTASNVTISNALCNAFISTTSSYVGGLVGNATTVTITSSGNKGSVSGSSYLGGLIGNVSTATITNSYASGPVTSTNYFVGGLAGYISSTANITSSYASGNVSGIDNVGGLVGRSTGGTISKCYASGNVTSNIASANSSYGTGGLIGYNSSILQDVYEAGDVTRGGASGYIGGLVGVNNSNISRAYVMGKLTNAQTFIHLQNAGTINNTYWIGETTGKYSGSYATLISSVQEATKSVNYGNFDFTNVWGIELGVTTPYLKGLMIPAKNYLSNIEKFTGEGTGTIDDPYLIRNVDDLNRVRLSLGSYYKMMNNIDLSTSEYASNFPTINGFNGTFDGNGYKLINLKTVGGLFNSEVQITVKNLTLENTTVTGTTKVGAVIGSGANVTLTNVSVIGTSTVTGTSHYVGGLVGYASTATITGSGSTATVNSGGQYLGGLLGSASIANVTNSYASGNVTGTSYYIGGLIGYVDTPTITLSYASGDVRGADNVGGFIGYTYGGTISKCYASGSVQSNMSSYSASYGTGGFIGYNRSVLQDVYEAGNVTRGGTSGYIGGLVGNNAANISRAYVTGKLTNVQPFIHYQASGTMTNTYWIGETTGVYAGSYATLIRSVQEATNSVNYVNFDFTNIWGIELGQTTPYLRGLMTPEKNYLENIVKFNGEGTGTIDDPYLVKTPTDLNNVRLSTGSYYKMMNDINMAGSAYANNFPTITGFNGTFDGNGYKISNLKTSNGLFNSEVQMTAKNLTLENTIVNGTTNVGAVVGSGANVTLTNINITGTSTVTATSSYVGGLVGTATTVTIQNSLSNATLNTTSSYVGGLIGNVGTVTITNSGSTGNVSGVSYTGGLVGSVSTATITNSYASGNVVSNNYYVGGLAGYITSTANITSSYASGNVSGIDNVGGLIGRSTGGTISKCYASGNVTSNIASANSSYGTGGLIGYNSSTLQDVYEAGDVTRGGASGYIGGLVGVNNSNITRAYVTGKLTNVQAFIHLQNAGTMTNTYWIGETTGVYAGSYATLIRSTQEATNSANYVNFDFTNVWGIEFGQTTPYLKGLMIPEKNYLENIVRFNGEGTGTIDDPYLVKTPDDLNNVRLSTGSYYKMMNDIDMSGSTYASNFPTINGFNGTFDGNGYKISNLKTTNGLFNSEVQMTVKNLTLENTIVSGTTKVGAVVGSGANVTLTNVSVTGTSTVTGTGYYVGGLIGYAPTVTISGSGCTASITGSSYYVGGIAGYVSVANVTNSYASGNVTGSSYFVGGLIGYVDTPTITNSYASGDVRGTDNVGGFIGYTYGGTISKCYASGNVTSNTSSYSTSYGTGGFIGYNRSVLQDVYEAGNVTRGSTSGYIGGLVGNNAANISRAYVTGKLTNVQAFIHYQASGTMTNTYWIGETTGVYAGSYATLIRSVQEATNSVNYVNFDFTNVWGIELGQTTPYLRGLMTPEKNYLENIVKFNGEGTGTIDDPYLVKTADDLNNVRLSTGSYYKMMNDIDMAGSAYANNFPTITGFNGTFDGNGYKISNLKTPNGLFNSEVQMTAKNLTLENTIVNGTTNVGAVVGSGANVTLTNINVTGTSTVTATSSYVGGLVGTATTVTIQNSLSNATLNTTSSYVGGLIGNVGTVTITNSGSTGNVSGSSYTGGLVGSVSTATITNSYASGNVVSTNYYVGGLAGYITSTANITSSYASGNVSGIDNVGGFIGRSTGGTISKCYASGNVTSNIASASSSYGTGGFIGYNSSTLQDVYEAGDVTRGGASGYIGGLVGVNNSNITRAYVTGKLTNVQAFIHLQNAGTMTNTYWIGETTSVYSGSYATLIRSIQEATNSANYVNFDFTNVWGIEFGVSTPYLKGLMIPEKNYLENIVRFNGEGTGTVSDPYLVKTPDDLNNVRLSTGSYYKMMNDIDMSGSTYASNFPTINGFNGTFDGNGYKISNLKTTTGLFNSEVQMTVKNLTLENTIVSGTTKVGAVVGSGANVTLTNVSVTGTSTVTGTGYYVGGLIGYAPTVTISGSGSNATINGGGYYVGGLVGYTSTAGLTNSYASGNVTGSSYFVGGLIGYVDTPTITNSYASGDVRGTDNVGGFIGYTYGGTISKCYASGNVTSNTSSYSTSYGTGGFIGYNRSVLQDVYEAGNVTRGSTSGYIGGLVGNNAANISRAYVTGKLTNVQAFIHYQASGTMTNTYWIGETTGVYAGSYATLIRSVQEATNSANYVNFDFTNVWGIELGVTTPYIKGLMIPSENYLENMIKFTGEGTGTIDDPYLVKTPDDLNNVRLSTGSYYKMMNDIDMAGSAYANNFPTITGFNGTFDGNGYKISNLKTSNGLFNSEVQMTAKNLTLENTIVNGTTNVGAVVGSGANVTLTNINVTGTSTVTATSSYVGGLVGTATTVTIQNSLSNAALNTTSSYVGGLIGNVGTVTITNSGSTGNVSGVSYTGGLVGSVSTATITNSYASGNVVSNNYYVGGLAGYITSTANITSSYASGNVSGIDNVGGFIGRSTGGTISKCYASGNVTSNIASASSSYGTGGFIGYNSSTLQDVYEAGDVTRGGASGYIGGLVGVNNSNITRAYVTGKLTNVQAFIHLQNAGTMTNTYWIGETTLVYSGSYATLIRSTQEATNSVNYVNFDFTNVWGIEFGVSTPYLKGLMIPDKNYLVNINKFTGEGTGTVSDPYLIKTPDDLNNVRLSTGSYYKMMNDIDMSGSTYASNFPTINGFNGTFDGNGYKISNLKTTTGLFNSEVQMTVKNLTLENTIVSGTTKVGAVVGSGANVTLTNVSVTGTSTVTGTGYYVGGLIGYAPTVTITGSGSNATINGGGYYVGGLVGYTSTAGVTNSYASGNVTGSSYFVGGLIGYVDTPTITNSYASGDVRGTDNVGGFIGYTYGGTISKCYASGNVQSNVTSASTNYGTGGFIGYNRSVLQDVYEAGNVTRGSTSGYIGGLVGTNYGNITRAYVMGLLTNTQAFIGYKASGTMTNTYWIGETTGISTGSNATLISTKVDATNSAKYTGFDFSTIWYIEAGHTTPYLRGLAIPSEVYIIP